MMSASHHIKPASLSQMCVGHLSKITPLYLPHDNFTPNQESAHCTDERYGTHVQKSTQSAVLISEEFLLPHVCFMNGGTFVL